MTLEPVIGLEIHIQLKTTSKMFCGCLAKDSDAPNTNVCPICLGHPGALPVPNEQAIRYGTLIGLALGCHINETSKFDRKHYFYPDLPKGYQISQFDIPIAEDGAFRYEVPNGIREQVSIRIERAHLEEDAAKSFHHEDGKTYVDYNRAGTPLVEIVTGPDFKTPQEAKLFLQELRLIARYLGVSDADMEKGQLRCDANISLRQFDDEGKIVGLRLNPKTEIKNMNSFKHVERALEYEIERQSGLFQAGSPPSVTTTRTWNEGKQKTIEMRSKEGMADYRYFPEPDLPPLSMAEVAKEMRRELPELPIARRARFVDEYKLKREDAKIICENPYLADFTEAVFSELFAWIQALPELNGAEDTIIEKERAKLAKLVSTWLLTKLQGLLGERKIDIRIMKISPENFAEFVTLIATNKLSSSAGLTVLGVMLDDGSDPSHVMEEKQLGKIEDEGMLAEIVDRVIEANPNQVEAYKNGKEELLKFFIGMVMKETEGAADAKLATNILKVKLNS